MFFDIVTIKDPTAAVLRTVCHDVKVFNRELFDLAQNLVDTMFAANGVGLAAPQVGIKLNLFVMRTAAGLANNTRDVHILVNPQSSTNNTEKYRDMEGCLSIPGLLGRVERYKELQCAYVNVEGRPQTAALAGLPARFSNTNWTICTACCLQIRQISCFAGWKRKISPMKNRTTTEEFEKDVAEINKVRYAPKHELIDGADDWDSFEIRDDGLIAPPIYGTAIIDANE